MTPFTPTSPPKPGESATCPHCGVYVHFPEPHYGDDHWHNRAGDLTIEVTVATCPSCEQPVVRYSISEESNGPEVMQVANRLMWPLGPAFRVPEQVPESIRNDFLEASEVLSISPKASAALSRRCLQAVLSDAGGATQRHLSQQIEAVKDRLSPEMAKDLLYVKEVGDFSAHEQKDQATGQILDVKVGEAEWNLFVLQELFAELYAKPERSRAMRKAFNKKSLAAGRRAIGDESDLPDPDEHEEGTADERQAASAGEPQSASRLKAPLDIEQDFPPEEDLPF